jgi:hypothetical protein
MSHWRQGPPIVEDQDSYDSMLAVVETNVGAEFYLCRLDDSNTLVDIDSGDDYGWEADVIDRWCPLDEVLELIGCDKGEKGEEK